MYYHITNSEINILSTLNATFTELLHSQLTVYSNSDEQGWRKTDNLPQRFGLLHYGKQITKRLIFWCSPLTFDWNLFFVFMWLNSMYSFVLSLMKINYDSKNPNNCVMKIYFQSWFLFDWKICDSWVILCNLLDLTLFLGCFNVNDLIKILT